ncbi:LysR substrate-binding domain-containing protein [Photobacterium minamisatsumaniensis]|uniref:LysR substrate-binding domain-containing protein n=1 Tax=Photobacterium minamisatsumaniensis TaxID=2910233 RepID=UPI003D10A8AD
MRKLVPLKSIYAFVAVAETGSMTEAAEHLNVSHSAVSQSIKALESQLNIRLFRRVGRRVELNQDGRRYYSKVAPALTQIVEASESLANKGQGNRLTLNMVNSLALHWWIPRVSDFQHHAPHIDVRISNIIHVFDLEHEGVDIALIHGQSDDWQDYHCEKLGDDELIMVCSPHLIEGNEDISPAELLAQFPAIFTTNPRRKNDWQVWCDANSLVVPSQQRNLSFTASVQAVQATIRRLGVLITHKQFVRDDIKHGMLVQVGEPVLNPHHSFYFVCQPDKLKLESVLTLRNWLKAQFIQQPS